MILKLLQTSLLCGNMLLAKTPIINTIKNEEQPRIQENRIAETTTQEYTLNVPATFRASSSINYLGFFWQETYRYSLSQYNNAINVSGTIYQEIKRNYIDYDTPITASNDVIIKPDIAPDPGTTADTKNVYSRVMYVLKILPYNLTINTTTTINLHIDSYVRIGFEDDTDILGDIKLSTTIITTKNNLDTYIGRTTNTWNQTQYWWDEITGPENGFIYNETIRNQVIDTITVEHSNIDENITTTFPIEIVKDQYNNANYVVIMQYLEGHTRQALLDGEWHLPRILSRNANRTLFDIASTNVLTINGEYIVITGGTIEVIDIPGVMFDVLTMPFSFISIAFNLTLFPGTPYQINLSNLFLSIIAVIVFVFIMKIISKANSKGGD